MSLRRDKWPIGITSDILVDDDVCVRTVKVEMKLGEIIRDVRNLSSLDVAAFDDQIRNRSRAPRSAESYEVGGWHSGRLPLETPPGSKGAEAGFDASSLASGRSAFRIAALMDGPPELSQSTGAVPSVRLNGFGPK